MVQHSSLDHTGLTGVPSGTAPNPTTIELGHASDTTLARIAAGRVSIEGNEIYKVGGTDVALADGGTGASLTDPNADRILFWDDSAGQLTWLAPGTGLTITTTTIDATGGGGAVATDTIWDAKGDLAGGTGADTAAKLTVGANGAILEAQSAETTGLKWKRTIRGRVNADGTVQSGTGFSSAKNSTGDYTVTFTSAFGAVPIAFVQPDGPGASRFAFIFDTTTGDLDIITTNFAGSNTDADFSFLAMDV